MSRRDRLVTPAALALLLASLLPAQDDVVMRAMKDELARTLSQLRMPEMDKPYFVAYRVDEVTETEIAATLGSLSASHSTRQRRLAVEVRVGDYALDSSNYFSFRTLMGGGTRMLTGVGQAPLDDNYREIRRQLWLATDSEYKRALENLSGKRAALQMRQRSDDVPDFSKETPATSFSKPETPAVDVARLESMARELSSVFRKTPAVLSSSVKFQVRHSYSRYVNSEGSAFTRSQSQVRIEVKAEAQADDGLPIRDEISVWGRSASALPPLAELKTKVQDLAVRLVALRKAATSERYSGPVLFEGLAAAEILEQALAPALVATRQPLSDDPRMGMIFSQFNQMGGGTSLLDKVGARVLPEGVTLIDDPGRESYGETPLLGHYRVDDDGVAPRATTLVDNGVLKTLLAGRAPVQSIRSSTGHRRGLGVVPGNLILTSQKTASAQELRRELLRRAKLRGLEYALVVRRVGANKLNPLMRMAAMMGAGGAQMGGFASLAGVSKLFPDGHEEPLRGVEIAEITPAAFRDIVAIGGESVVLNEQFLPNLIPMLSFGFAFAGEPELPVVSIVSPSLLFEDLSFTKSQGPFPRPPVSGSPLAAP